MHNEGVGGPFVSVEWEIMGRSWEITGDRARWHAEVGPVVLKTQNLDIECGWRSEDINWEPDRSHLPNMGPIL